MLVVRIELWPKGDRRQAKVLHTAQIANNGKGSLTVGNYTATFSARGGKTRWRTSRVSNFPRKAKGAWYLLYEALKNALDHE